MNILEATAKTIVTLELTDYNCHRLDTMIEALHTVLNEGDFKAALGAGNMMVDDLEAAGEAIEWLGALRAVVGGYGIAPPDG